MDQVTINRASVLTLWATVVAGRLGYSEEEALGPVSAARVALAAPRERDDFAREAYSLYEAFRPSVPSGEAGWGAPGVLDLKKFRELAR